jgi:hypothetical protein
MPNWLFFIAVAIAWVGILTDPDVTKAHAGLCLIATVIASNGQHSINTHRKQHKQS